MTNIKILRTRIKEASTDGLLLIDGLHIADTAEATPHRLPAGEYEIKVKKLKKYHRKMPVIVSMKLEESDLSDPSEPSEPSDTSEPTSKPITPTPISMGNGVYALKDGTILVGEHLVPGVLINTKEKFDTLFDRIRKNAERGNTITLTIKEKGK